MLLQIPLEKVLAQGPTLIPKENIHSDCDFVLGNIHWNCFPAYIQYLAYIIAGFTVAICLIMLIINGYKYALGPVFGQGSNENAKKGIMFSLLGVGIALLAYLIVDTVIVGLTEHSS